MSGLPPQLRARLWILSLALVLLALAWDTRARLEHSAHASALTDRLLPPPARDPASPTGYSDGQRRLILNDAGADGYHWIMHTQAMFARGEARIRHVDYDNAPDGREVHWASLFRWWLGALAWIDHTITGNPIGLSVERAAVVASPLLLALLLPALVIPIARRFGSEAATLTAGTFIGARACYAYFLAGNPDHHGIAIAAAFLCVLGVVAGGAGAVMSAGPNRLALDLPSARRWFTLSAIAGGIGLWNSAATQIQVLAGLGLGAIAAMALLRRSQRDAGWQFAPELWRHWGIAGAASSLIAYAIEYLPGDASMRLEVNHPLHALAWLGAGEVLCRIGRILAAGTGESRARDIRGALAAAALVALPPLAILIGGRDVFVVVDKFYSLLSVGYTSEGQSVAFHLHSGTIARAIVVMCLPALVVVPLALAACRRDLHPVWRAQLALGLLPALVLLAWGAAEIRWLGMAVAIVAIPWLVALAQPQARWLRRAALAATLTLLPGLYGLFAYAPADFTKPEVYRIVERDLAQWLRRRTGADPFVVAAGPGRTSSMIYFGGGRGLGTFYWENRKGIEHAATLFRSASADEVRALLRQHGVTHVVLPTWDRFEQVVRTLDTRLHPDATPAEPFLNRIARTKVMPAWLRLLPYPFPRHPMLEGDSVLVLEFDESAHPADAPNHLAQFLLETGQPETALRLRSALERAPFHLPAWITLARCQQEAGRAAEAAATLERLAQEYPGQPALSCENHLRLAGVLTRARQGAAARTELERGLRMLDEKSLRHLTPAVITEMSILAEALSVSFPDTRLRDLATSLAPPSVQSAP